MTLAENIVRKFKERYSGEPLVVKSPGRVNLIGEHTDYNLGYVLPAAINKAIYIAITPRSDNNASVFALDMNDGFEFSLNNLREQKTEKQWPNYLMGIVEQLIKAGYDVKGFNCVFGGDIPIGAGLSSSAALEAGLGYALNKIFNLNINKLSLVKYAQKAENEFVGVNCGIMDQFINIFGKSDNALRIDCRSLKYEYFPFDYENISIVLLDTGVSHSLASSEYNLRRKECADGVEIIKKNHNNVQSLRDVSKEILSEYKDAMDSTIYKRCKYVVEENERLLEACDALSMHDLKKFGSLMYKTHDGLSKDYDVSCEELDYLVGLTKDNPKIYGARMMGGGFGGCTINLVSSDAIEEISKEFSQAYYEKFKIKLKVYITKINGGTEAIRENGNGKI